MKIPPDILQVLSDSFGINNIHSFHPASGGCINNGGRANTNRGDYFLKWNHASRFPAMFEAEAKGLQLLHDARGLKIPEVVGTGTGSQHSFILMEFIGVGRRSADFFQQMALGLVKIHKVTSEDFGLDHNNYIGSLPQYNEKNKDWVEFFIAQRLEPQLKLAIDSGEADRSAILGFEKLYKGLSSHFPTEYPALVHGDLWSGNYLEDEKGAPVLIDPATYFGHRETDLAMTRLFGGFNSEFYNTYQEEFPLEPGFDQRVDLYNLYPLLVHVNLFGGGYWMQVKSIIKRFT